MVGFKRQTGLLLIKPDTVTVILFLVVGEVVYVVSLGQLNISLSVVREVGLVYVVSLGQLVIRLSVSIGLVNVVCLMKLVISS